MGIIRLAKGIAMLKEVFTSIFDHLIKARCIICLIEYDSKRQNNIHICPYCSDDLAIGEELTGDLLQSPTIKQDIIKPQFDHLLSLSRYQWPVNQLITQFKYNQNQQAGKTLSHLLAHKIQMHIDLYPHLKPDLIIPVPLAPFKYLFRGFNQSLFIAEVLQRSLNIPLNKSVLTRTRWRKSQASKGRIARLTGNKNDFNVRKKYDFSQINHVAIVDDVITTGSTANQISRTLKNSGVKKVSIWTLAVTPKAGS